MSSLQHMFGNVDEKGKLDADLPEELRETLEDSSDYLSTLLGDLGFDTAGDGTAGGAESVQPNADAIDFSGIGNEDLEEDGVREPYLPQPMLPSTTPYVFIPPSIPATRPSFIDDYEGAKALTQPARIVYDASTLARLFPGYDERVMKFSTMFSAKFVRRARPARKLGRHKVFSRMQPYPVAHDERELFRQRLPPQEVRRPLMIVEPPREPVSVAASIPAASAESSKKEPWEEQLSESLYPIMLERWEDRVMWDEDSAATREGPQPSRICDAFQFRNYDLDTGEWEDGIQWEDEVPQRQIVRPTFTSPIAIASSSRQPHRRGVVDIYKSRMKRFNISQDRYYEGKSIFGADRVRQTYGPGTLQHAFPAVRLHPQYFKHNLSKKELRSFHRPALRPPLNTPFHFSRVRQLKKKKMKGTDYANIMRTTRDITLKDSARYVLLEYSEEYPPIMMNTGMGSLIYNYYRKIGEKDTTVPDMDVGAPFVLEEVDASPFMGFGDVEPGQSIQAFTNNMFRAPIFRQKASETDFLVIRHTYKGESKYYIREIPILFTVGQTFPLQEVPRPQSRKITHTVKGRLQVATFRYMRRDPHKLLRYEAIVKQFSHFTEPQLRQRLKEFAQFAVKGENTGYWKLKPGISLLGEDEIQRLVTPEMICLQECMQTGQQRLVDIGYSDMGMEDENDEDEATGDIEVQLAPWTTTKNFVLASQNKSMIKLYGPGDPSGRGEAFSFIRASMKEPFLRYGESAEDRQERDRNKPKSSHRFSFAEQQQVYREEIKRIWDAQLASLGATEKPHDEEEHFDIEALSSHQRELELDEETQRQHEYGYMPDANNRANSPPAFDRSADDRDQYSDAEPDETTSVAESGTSYGQTSKTKRLTIRRLFRNNRGEEEERSEVITDMKIINAYLRQRAIIENQEALQEADANAELERKRKRRRVREHVDQMKENRKGKRRKDEEDNERRGPPVMLKIRNTSTSNLSSAQSGSRSKRGSTAGGFGSQELLIDDYNTHAKSYGRRRAAPEVDLAAHLSRVINDLITIPEAYEFCRPVSQVHVPDYYVIIKRPRTLEQIRDDVRNYNYKTPAEFMRDLSLVADNCRLYNGALHPLTVIADSLVSRARKALLDAGLDLSDPPSTDTAQQQPVVPSDPSPPITIS
ncbi:hypothetical protein DFJ77DRAFT_466147 [Powellomyces hirtus]|nr:hypothetical protein DFJ77DRAFT_466147 [Powellomyces hirtus]